MTKKRRSTAQQREYFRRMTLPTSSYQDLRDYRDELASYDEVCESPQDDEVLTLSSDAMKDIPDMIRNVLGRLIHEDD